MRQNGKRFRSNRDESDKRNPKRRTERDKDRDEVGKNETIVYRILCPDTVIGSVIGKNGKVINSIRDDSRAKVKVMDPFLGAKDRVIAVHCHVREKQDIKPGDEFDAAEPYCPAQDALLKVHDAIANAVSVHGEDSDRRRKDKGNEECQLLVPSSQAANLIGKSGATVKNLRNRTRANIKVIYKDHSNLIHSCALEFDNFVVISGDAESVKRAIFAVSTIMYKFSPKESIPLDSSMPEETRSIIIPTDLPLYTDNGLYDPINSARSSLGHHHILGHTRALDVQGSAVYPSAVPMVSGYGSERAKELIVRVICPSNKIGHVIGKGGISIKCIRQESGARIEVDDANTTREEPERLITVISTESSDDHKSMAVEAVLLLQYKINDDDNDDVVTQRLLVPSKVIGCIIGKSGSIISEIRKRTRANIRISKAGKLSCADYDDEVIEISGQVGRVRDALIEIVLRLREHVLKDREEGHILSSAVEKSYSGDLSRLAPSLSRSSTRAALAYEPRADAGYGYGSLPIDDDGYGSLPQHTLPLYAGLTPPSTMEMIIPAPAVGKVMGISGTNIDNIRKISGAAVNILDSKSSHGDRVALISGTSEQKRSAENLIRAFIMST